MNKVISWIFIVLLLPGGLDAFPLNFEAGDSEIGADTYHEFEFDSPLLTTSIEIDWSEFGVGVGRGVDLDGIVMADIDLTATNILGFAAALADVVVDNSTKKITLNIVLGLLLGGGVTIRVNDIINPPSPLTGNVVVRIGAEFGETEVLWSGGTNDADDDGLPDGYERYYAAGGPAYRDAGFDPNVAGNSGADFDGDGATNWREFMGATNPANASSFPSTADSDGDFIYDIDESFPGQVVDTDNDGTPDYQDSDSDADGIPDRIEAGDENLQTRAVDTDNDGIPDYRDLDSDADGVLDEDDNCRVSVNANQLDTDDDGKGDVCDTDDDDDGVLDSSDNCQLHPNTNQEDNDGDGAGDACDTDDDDDGIEDEDDNCRLVSNPNQRDSDGDGVGDACQGDLDGDGVMDNVDNCPLVKNDDQKDSDGDGDGDLCDPDDDNDTIVDPSDNCPFISNLDQADTDQNGVGDACDLDSFRVKGSGCHLAESTKPRPEVGFLFLIIFYILFIWRRKLS